MNRKYKCVNEKDVKIHFDEIPRINSLEEFSFPPKPKKDNYEDDTCSSTSSCSSNDSETAPPINANPLVRIKSFRKPLHEMPFSGFSTLKRRASYTFGSFPVLPVNANTPVSKDGIPMFQTPSKYTNLSTSAAPQRILSPEIGKTSCFFTPNRARIKRRLSACYLMGKYIRRASLPICHTFGEKMTAVGRRMSKEYIKNGLLQLKLSMRRFSTYKIDWSNYIKKSSHHLMNNNREARGELAPNDKKKASKNERVLFLHFFRSEDLENEYLGYFNRKHVLYYRIILFVLLLFLFAILLEKVICSDIFGVFPSLLSPTMQVLEIVSLVLVYGYALVLVFVLQCKKINKHQKLIEVSFILLTIALVATLFFVSDKYAGLEITFILVYVIQCRFYVHLLYLFIGAMLYTCRHTILESTLLYIPFLLMSFVFVSLKSSNFEYLYRDIFEVESDLQKVEKMIAKENDRRMKILRNVFPSFIMESEMFETFNRNYYRNFQSLVVLLADMKGFSVISSRVRCSDLILYLDMVYSNFDEICSTKKIEKIKSIGDAWLGYTIPEKYCRDLSLTVNTSLMMLETFLEISNIEPFSNLGLRIGISMGPGKLVIFGKEHYSFDCFGACLEEAKILESTSKTNCIQVNEKIKGHTENMFEYSKNGEIGYLVDKKRSVYWDVKQIPAAEEEETVQSVHSGFINNPLFSDWGQGGGPENERLVQKEEEFDISKSCLSFNTFKTNRKFLNTQVRIHRNYLVIYHIFCLILYITVLLINIFMEIGDPASTQSSNFIWEHWIWIGVIISYILVICAVLCCLKNLNFMLIFCYFGLIVSILWVYSTIYFFKIKEQTDLHLTITIMFIFVQSMTPLIHHFVKVLVVMSYVLFYTLIFIFNLYSFERIFLGVLNYLCFVSIFMCCGYIFEYKKSTFFKNTQLLEIKLFKRKEELEKNEKLLQSSLPLPVIKKLVKVSQFRNKYVRNGTVMFLEFSNITVESFESLKFLNAMFINFDDILQISKRTCKIKQIGTTYISCGGLGLDYNDTKMKKKKEDHPYLDNKTDLLDTAIKMKNCFMKYIERNQRFKSVVLKIGCHAGPFSCGIVGKTKFLFDVFGTTINLAYRLQQTAEDNSIHCSRNFIRNMDKISFIKKKCDLKGHGIRTTFVYRQ